ncbi:valacyclovir hydrolase-like [Lytechinus variegatus]|uniref:valacyclovir hydrolase-like n=1 Tax=Lytechinus variegatus TaxID=7654 RepID=UPI001BB2C3FF|nr:valacyclovir hydrolase-like [Lytechinus variegatus]
MILTVSGTTIRRASLSKLSRLFASPSPAFPVQICAKMSSNNRSSGISSGKVGVNGVNLYYEQAGNGPEPVLLMPGALGSTQTDFKPQLEKLNRDLLTVIAFDPRGYGKSQPPERDFPLDFFNRDAKDARDLMQALGHKKYSLMGWSDGGITALILAGTYTDEVKKLLLWGANSYITEDDLKLYEATRDVTNWSERMRAPMEAVYGKENFEKIWHGWCDAVANIYSTNNGDLCKAETKNIRCPTLIIHGDLDAMVVPEHPEYLHNTIKGSKLIRWPKAKHNLHLRYADEFNKEAEQFLTETQSNL